MAQPKVTITLSNGALANPGTVDGVAGLVAYGVAVPGLPLLTPTKFTSLKALEDAGVTEAGDTTNSIDVWRQCSEFFGAGGSELWLMTCANTLTMTQICDVANDNAKKLLNAAGGRIRILGVSRKTPSNFTSTASGGLDQDVSTALPKAQALAEQFTSEFKPVRIILDGIHFTGNPTVLTDLRTLNYNRVAVTLCGATANAKNASVGLVLGVLSKVPVQRKIGRVKSERLPISAAYLTNGNAVGSLTATQLDTIHDKGYILMREFSGRQGWWFANDPTATSLNDDYNSLSRGRVIDKAILVTYNTYVEELLDEVPVTDEGKVAPSIISFYKARIETALREQMIAGGEIQNASISIDENQQILLTNRLEIVLRILPVGYLNEVSVSLGFTTSVA